MFTCVPLRREKSAAEEESQSALVADEEAGRPCQLQRHSRAYSQGYPGGVKGHSLFVPERRSSVRVVHGLVS